MTNSLASTPNSPAFAGYLSYKKQIVGQGIDIYELQSKNSPHTKSFVFDHDLLAIGTFNLDSRSTYLSTESMVIVHSEEAVEALAKSLGPFIEKSLLAGKDGKYLKKEGLEEMPTDFFKRIGISFLSIFAKLFSFLL